MNNEILKPLTVARHEFVEALTDLINGCQLPPFVIEAVLKDMYNDVHKEYLRQIADTWYVSKTGIGRLMLMSNDCYKEAAFRWMSNR